jgi:hypothetical protein
LAIGLLVLGVHGVWLSAQSVVVPLSRVGELKRVYPFVRFETLAGFAAPMAQPSGVSFAPHAAGDRAAALVVPPTILRLSGTKMSVRGYMLPLALDGRGVSTFLLMKSIDSCHFGAAVGAANEWISVRLPAGRAGPYEPGRPITAFGTLTIAPEYLGGVLSQLYTMRVDYIAVH